ncbi:MAG TPA: hypothetical protein VMR52_08630 [Dehalococcoidia bacterium]|nr:hypothetical protein [Dehalococcoidia bacterium]
MVMQLVSRLAQNLVWIGVVAFILAASAASAQSYPPPVDTVTAGADDTTPDLGATVELTASAVDDNGGPLADVDVTFTITSNPGGASFVANQAETATALTDKDGIARVKLFTGNEPGTIVVRVDANGVVSQITLTTGSPQALPKTGSEPGGATSLPLSPAMAAVAAILLLVAGTVAVRRLHISGS